MKIQYFPDTDSLHIALSERDSDSSEALSENLVVDKAAGSRFGLIAHQSSSWVSRSRAWGSVGVTPAGSAERAVDLAGEVGLEIGTGHGSTLKEPAAANL